MGFFEKIKRGLAKTKNALAGTIDNVLSAFGVISDDLYEELEETLIMADIGVETSLAIIAKLKENVKENESYRRCYHPGRKLCHHTKTDSKSNIHDIEQGWIFVPSESCEYRKKYKKCAQHIVVKTTGKNDKCRVESND